MAVFDRPGIDQIVIQQDQQFTPDWRNYVAPIRGMNSMVQEWHLHPEDGYAPLIKNFLPTLRGTLQKRKGMFPLVGVSDNDHPIEFFQLGDHEGKVHTLGLTDTRSLRRYVTGTGDALNTSEQIDLSSILTAEPNALFFGIIEGTGKTFLYITSDDFTNPVLKYEIKYSSGSLDNSNAAAAGSFTDPGGGGDNDGWDTLNARHLTAYRNFLILCNTREQIEGQSVTEDIPHRFRWSNYGRPEDFRDTEGHIGGYVDLDDDELNGPIITTLNLRNTLVVYKPNAVYNMALRTDGSFFKEMKIRDRGIISPKGATAVRNGSYHLVVSHDNIYLYDGFDFTEPPVGDKIRSFFYEERLDWSSIETLYAANFPERNECWIFFDARANNKLGLTSGREAICWNWERNAWTWHDLGLRCAFGSTSIDSSGTHATRSPYFLGSLEDTGTVRLFEHPYDLTNNSAGEIEGMIVFPLVFKFKGQKPVQHVFERPILLQATMERDTADENDVADHYELWMRHADNPTLRISNTETSASDPSDIATDIAGFEDVPWHNNELIQFNPANDEIPPPKFYQGLVLTAKSRKISEEISMVRFQTVDKEGAMGI